MRKVRVPLTNFQFGEVSPSLTSRTDSPLYNQSAQRVENFFLRSEGGILKRSGLEAIYEYDTTINTSKTQQCRLAPFIFSDDEQYIISIENAKLRVFQISPSTGNVSLIQTITQNIASAALPFDHDFLHEYTFAQAGDVMFICHQLFIPQMIVRTSLTTFQIESFAFDQKSDNKEVYQPYYPFQTAGMTLDPSASSGNDITLTTSSAYWDTGTVQVENVADGSMVTNNWYIVKTLGTSDFTTVGAHSNAVGQVFKATGVGDATKTGTVDNVLQPKHIGVTVRYNGNEIEIDDVQSSTVATGDVLDALTVRLTANSLRTNNGSAAVEVTLVNHGLSVGDSITFADADTIGGITNSNINGARTVATVISDDAFTFTAGGSANDSVLGGGTPTITTHAPTTTWDEQSYSSLRGFPAAVTFHENRLVFAGTLAQPDSIWFSKSGKFFNFDVGDSEDNDSIQISASVGEVQQIRHIVSNRDLQVFAASAEMYIPAFQNQPLTPLNAQLKKQTPFGSGFSRPQLIDGATLFLQKGGQIAREYIFADGEKAYIANPISTTASHLIKSPVEMNTLYGALSRSESYVFVLNNDGTLAVFNSNRAEQRAGWVEFTTDGVFHSTVTIDDRVFANVEYDLGDGSTKIILCEFNKNFNLDMAKTYTGTAGVFDVSADFNDGAVLQVINGNNFIGQFTVASGNIDASGVDKTLTSVEIGKKFNVELKTNPLDAAVGNGPLTSLPRAVGAAFLDLKDTLSVKVNNTDLIIRNVTDDLSQQLQPVTGKKEFRLLGYSRDPQVTITQDAPLDLQVNGLVAELIF
jgi:hypothetical protein|tara:strand:- start:1710 stop:4130 length:2421 start_codon:yes stop_codon:yes gene_type:complete